MLVLSRKEGESIIIVVGKEEIILRIAKVDENNHVKVAIQAPREFSIHREEVYKSIRETNKKAAIKPTNLPNIAQVAKEFKDKSAQL